MMESKINRNDPCPCGSGKKFKKCCIDKYLDLSLKGSSMKEVFDGYMDWNSEFEKQLSERSKSEIDYDNAVLTELEKGRSIKKALDIAAKKYPNEALGYNSQNIHDIQNHYEYLLNHQTIKNRIQQMSN